MNIDKLNKWPDINNDDIMAIVNSMTPDGIDAAGARSRLRAALYDQIPGGGWILVDSSARAMQQALYALGVGFDDEVILPALAPPQAVQPVLWQKAEAVFVDIDPRTFCIDPARVEEAITNSTIAIVVIHTHGHMANMLAIAEIAARHKVAVIEDASEAFGATMIGRSDYVAMPGEYSDAAIFSFAQDSNLASTSGGAIYAKDSRVQRRLAAKIDDGDAGNLWLANDIDALAAVLCHSRLGRIREHNERAYLNAGILDAVLSRQPDLVTPPFRASSYGHMYTKYRFSINERLIRTRDDLQKLARYIKQSVPVHSLETIATPHQPLYHALFETGALWRDWSRVPFPNAERVARTTLCALGAEHSLACQSPDVIEEYAVNLLDAINNYFS